MNHAGEFLKQVRHEAKLTQEQMAERLGKRQPELSQIERRPNMLLSTFRRYVEAAGSRVWSSMSSAGRRYPTWCVPGSPSAWRSS